MTDFLQRLEESIQDRHLIPRGEKILIAVSGGVDSMVLLHSLNKLSTQHKWKIVIAHFNHRLRGRASDGDERLVHKTAANMRLPIVVEGADVKEFAKQSGLSIEMAARKLRHEFLARVAREKKLKTIALAHHADDQVELFFLRLLRGTGSEGLSGMRWHSASPADKTISLVRPLLNCTKASLQEFARQAKISFRDDATNFSSDFLRNRVRNELLPLLRKKYQLALNRTILRVMEIVAAESELVGDIASSVRLNSPGYRFQHLPVAVQRRVLQAQLVRAGVAMDFDLVESLRKQPNQCISVGANMAVLRDGNGEIRLREVSVNEFNPDELTVNLNDGAGETVFSGTNFSWRTLKSKKLPMQKAGREVFDADKIGVRIILRHWHVGDRFQPIGMKSPQKLQDLFTNAKIPREQRHSLVVAAAEEGEIFWVEGLRISENFKVTPKTKRRLIWHWEKR